MANHYGPAVRLNVVAFPLPYHIAAWKTSVGLQSIADLKPQQAYGYLDLMFEYVRSKIKLIFHCYF